MPEIPDVIATEPITVEWGNDIRDRVVQRYATISERSSESPSPGAGDLSYLADSGDVAVYHSGAWRKLVPAGVMTPFAGSSSPAGWLLCNGAAVSRTTYAELFAAIGTAWGAGDGSTTFNLPDMRQRFPLGVAASGTGNTLGATGGAIDHTHTGPSHTHTGPSHTHGVGTLEAAAGGTHNHDQGTSASGGSHSHSFADTSGGGSSGVSVVTGGAGGAAVTAHTHSVSGTTGSGGSHTHDLGNGGSGGSHTHTISGSTAAGGTGSTGAGGTGATGANNPPFAAVHYIIKA